MKNYPIAEKLIGAIEDEFEGYKIYIENNPDYHRGGYEWSVSKDCEMLDSGLASSIENALSEAQKTIIEFNKK